MKPYPDEPTQIVPATERVAAIYQEAGESFNPAMGVHTTRMLSDYYAGLPWSAAEAKHLRALRQQLGLPIVWPPSGPLPILRARGTQLVDQATGRPWKWKGVSAFRLFDEWQLGHDISSYCAWAVGSRLNLLRVFGMYCGGLGRLVPYEVPDYFAKVASFLEVVGTFGLSVEWVAFADMQTAALSRVDVQGHYANLVDRLLGRPGVVLEIVNEPFKNGLTPTDVYAPFSELAQAHGSYVPQNGQLPHGQYLTVHTPRDDEWPRKGKDILELTRLGWDANEWGPAFAPLNVPGIGDEPMGVGPSDSGRRSMVASDHASYHGVCHLFGSGSTIHGDFGIACRLPTPEEQAVVDAIVATWEAVPEDAQLWSYTRDGLESSPVEGHALREYGMVRGDRAVVVRVRPKAGVVPRNGWRVVTQRGHGGVVVELVR